MPFYIHQFYNFLHFVSLANKKNYPKDFTVLHIRFWKCETMASFLSQILQMFPSMEHHGHQSWGQMGTEPLYILSMKKGETPKF